MIRWIKPCLKNWDKCSVSWDSDWTSALSSKAAVHSVSSLTVWPEIRISRGVNYILRRYFLTYKGGEQHLRNGLDSDMKCRWSRSTYIHERRRFPRRIIIIAHNCHLNRNFKYSLHCSAFTYNGIRLWFTNWLTTNPKTLAVHQENNSRLLGLHILWNKLESPWYVDFL